MKKATFFILMIFCIGVIISCKKENTELRFTKMSGILQKQGNTTYMYGTHVLVDSNGATVVSLESDKLNLDDYINQVIEVKGHKVKELPEHGPDLIMVTKVK